MKIIFYLLLVLAFLLVGTTSHIYPKDENKTKKPYLLINISNSEEFYEFDFNLINSNIDLSNRGKVRLKEISGVTYIYSESPEYRNTFLSVYDEKLIKNLMLIVSENDEYEKYKLSPNKKLIAYTKSIFVRSKNNYDRFLYLFDTKTKKIISKIKFNHLISDFCWDPKSNKIYILTSTEYWGKYPFELIAACSGHPIPYVTFYLTSCNLLGKINFINKVMTNVRYGDGKIVIIY